MTKRDLALDLFKTFKTGVTRKPNKPAPTPRVGQPGDPELIGGVLNDLISDRDWDSGLAEGNLFVNWQKIVGDEIAQHAQPISILDNVLTIQSSSTAWATQLNLMAADLLVTIQKDATGVLIERLAIIGPQTPTWKKGIRTIRNARGPRDTYNQSKATTHPQLHAQSSSIPVHRAFFGYVFPPFTTRIMAFREVNPLQKPLQAI